jgi:hypothetical protein
MLVVDPMVFVSDIRGADRYGTIPKLSGTFNLIYCAKLLSDMSSETTTRMILWTVEFPGICTQVRVRFSLLA